MRILLIHLKQIISSFLIILFSPFLTYPSSFSIIVLVFDILLLCCRCCFLLLFYSFFFVYYYLYKYTHQLGLKSRQIPSLAQLARSAQLAQSVAKNKHKKIGKHTILLSYSTHTQYGYNELDNFVTQSHAGRIVILAEKVIILHRKLIENAQKTCIFLFYKNPKSFQ